MTIAPTEPAVGKSGTRRIEVTEQEISLFDFRIASRHVAEFLLRFPDEERSQAFVQAVEVGVFCLERATATVDIEFVRRRAQELINEVGAKIVGIPKTVERQLIDTLGTEDGQVLKPVVDLVNLVSSTTKERLNEVRQLLSDEIDPSKESSSMGQALRKLRDLLDPERKDSVQGALETAIAAITSADGELAKTVKSAVAEAVKPLKDEVDGLTKEIHGKEAAAEAVMQTIEKGVPYEEQVAQDLRPWSKAVGAELYHVGGDKRPGDVLIRFTETSIAAPDLCMVIEARDRHRAAGLKAIADDLCKAMVERGANAAIFLSRSREGFGDEVGDWAEGENDRGPWVATTHEHLHTAVRFLIVLHKLRSIRAAVPDMDASAVENQVGRIRIALKRINTVKRKVTDVHNSADQIVSEVDTLRQEIRESLIALEDAIHTVDSGFPEAEQPNGSPSLAPRADARGTEEVAL